MKGFLEKLHNILQNNTETLIQTEELVNIKRNLEQEIRENVNKLEKKAQLNELNEENIEEKNEAIKEDNKKMQKQLNQCKKANINLEATYKLKKKQAQETNTNDKQTLRANVSKVEQLKEELNLINAKLDNNLLIEIELESKLVDFDDGENFQIEQKQFQKCIEELERVYEERKESLKNQEIKFEQEIQELKRNQTQEIQQIFMEKMEKQKEKTTVENLMNKSQEMLQLENQINEFQNELNIKQQKLEEISSQWSKIKEGTRIKLIQRNQLNSQIESANNKK